MKNRQGTPPIILAASLCAGVLLLTTAVVAEPLDLTVPKTDSMSGLRIYSISLRNPTLAASLVLEQIEKKIEKAVTRVQWPRGASGERVYGLVRVAITIRVDGTVGDIEPMGYGSATDAALIEAATNVIYAAAPFAPIPREHFPGIDAIRFIRTFDFHREKAGRELSRKP